MNFSIWRKALTVIPAVSKDEWRELDLISKWLISTRAAVLIMTFLSALLAGLFAWRDNSFNFLPWLKNPATELPYAAHECDASLGRHATGKPRPTLAFFLS